MRLAAEMARVVDDGANLLVLPIVTRGPTENLNSLLYLRGVDLAIINSDALEEYRIAVPGNPAPRHLPAQSLPVGAAHLRAARDPEPAGPRRQEGELQHPGDGRRLLRPADLQPARHRRREDLHSAPGGAAADAQGRDGGGRVHHVEAGRRLPARPVGARLQVPAGALRQQIRGLLSARGSRSRRVSRPDQAGRAHLDHLGADRPGLLQLAGRLEPLPARRPLHRLPLQPDRQAAGARASTPNGRRSISARRCPASPASRRRRNGWTARRARRRQDNEDRRDLPAFAFALASPPTRGAGRRRCDGEAPRLLAAGAGRTAGLPGQALPRHRRRRASARRHRRQRGRRRPTTGSSARRPRRSTTRPSPSPPRRPAPGRMAPPCSSRSSAAAAAPSW